MQLTPGDEDRTFRAAQGPAPVAMWPEGSSSGSRCRFESDEQLRGRALRPDQRGVHPGRSRGQLQPPAGAASASASCSDAGNLLAVSVYLPEKPCQHRHRNVHDRRPGASALDLGTPGQIPLVPSDRTDDLERHPARLAVWLREPGPDGAGRVQDQVRRRTGRPQVSLGAQSLLVAGPDARPGRQRHALATAVRGRVARGGPHDPPRHQQAQGRAVHAAARDGRARVQRAARRGRSGLALSREPHPGLAPPSAGQ